MKVEATNPVTGSKEEKEFAGIDKDYVETFNSTEADDHLIRNYIENLNVSADIKSVLIKVAQLSVKAGQYIIKIGRKIFDIVLRILKEFPNALFGIVLGGVFGILVASIPFIGSLIAPLFTSLAMLSGFLFGVKQDISDKRLENAIARAQAGFSRFAE